MSTSLTNSESCVGGGGNDVSENNSDVKLVESLSKDETDYEDKGHTFRKRRLSLTNLSQLDTESAGRGGGDVVGPTNHEEEIQQDEGGEDDVVHGQGEHTTGMPPLQDDRAHSFRKRRLSLTQNRAEPDGAPPGEGCHNHNKEDNTNSPNHKRHRRNSDASASTLDSHGNAHHNTANPPRYLKSRTLHAAELLSHPPPSPALRSVLPKLYQKAAPPQNLPLLDNTWEDGNHDDSPHAGPKWKKRHTRRASDHDRNLPFPLDVVGTFSCHGVEPVYDSDFQLDNDEEDDDDSDNDNDDWGGAGNAPPGSAGGKHVMGVFSKSYHPASVSSEKPTMAAKINQDRGGVACPYGNSARTAIFAVYDGTATVMYFGEFVSLVISQSHPSS
jgi:hypothetical protein